MREIGYVNVVVVGMQTVNLPLVIVSRVVAEVPVAEVEVSFSAQKGPADDAGRVYKMNFEIGCASDFVEIETWFRKARQRLQRASL